MHRFGSQKYVQAACTHSAVNILVHLIKVKKYAYGYLLTRQSGKKFMGKYFWNIILYYNKCSFYFGSVTSLWICILFVFSIQIVNSTNSILFVFSINLLLLAITEYIYMFASIHEGRVLLELYNIIINYICVLHIHMRCV